MALKCNKCGTVGSDVLFQPVEGRCPNCGSHSISPLQGSEGFGADLVDHLELFNLKVHEAFAYGDITVEQYVWIIDMLTTVKHEIDKIIKGGDK